MTHLKRLTWLVISQVIVINTVLAMDLVSTEEAQRSQAAPAMVEVEATPSDPLAPSISIIDPQEADQFLKNPFKMEVAFKPQRGAKLDLSSFKAFYGAFKIDITDRLLKEATKTATGLRLANVNVPTGSHRIILRIKDDQNRLAEKELHIKVD